MKDKLPNAFMSALLRGFRALAGFFRVRAIGILETEKANTAVIAAQAEIDHLKELLASARKEAQANLDALGNLPHEYQRLKGLCVISHEFPGQSAFEALDKLRVEHGLLQRRYEISQDAAVTGWFRDQPPMFTPFVAKAIEQEAEPLLEEIGSARSAHAETQQPAARAPEKRQRIRNKPKRTSAKAKP